MELAREALDIDQEGRISLDNFKLFVENNPQYWERLEASLDHEELSNG